MGITRPGLGRQRLAYGLIMCFLLGSILTLQLPASANHPASSCLDVEPETDSNPTGTTHTVTATLRTTDVAVPLTPKCPDTNPDQNNATNTKQATTAVVVNFEITGVNDPDASDSPGTPDRTCTIQEGQTSCGMPGYVGLRNGGDTIRGWIDGHPMDADEPRDAEPEQRPSQVGGDEPDTTDVVAKTWESASAGAQATTLDCEPETDSNPAGDPHTVTCTARNQHGGFTQGTQVDSEATGTNDPDGANGGSPDFSCQTDANGQCSFTHGPGGTGAAGSGSTNNVGTTTYRSWIDDDGQPNNTNEGDQTETTSQNDADDTDTVEKTWTASPLECTPETDFNPAGTNHTVTCTARDNSGIPASGQRIHAEATGANDTDGNTPTTPDFTCTTSSDDPNTTQNEAGTCSFTHGPGGNPPRPTNSAGTTTYRVWQDTNNDPGSFEGDAGEGRDETTQAGSVSEPDRTDVVEKTWTASRIDCNPETDRNPTGTAHTVQCRASDQNNANVANASIDVEAVGANDPDGSESFETPDFSCVTASTGLCTITHGPGGVGTTNASGTTIYAGWIDVDGSNTTPEVDRNEGRLEGTDTSEPDGTDVVEKTWIASRLDCSPESDTNPAQSAHVVTCSAIDSSGTGTAGINIDVEATGANDPDNGNSFTTPDFSCTTGSDGSCSFTHGPGGRGTTNAFGRTLYRAWIDADGNDATTEADPTEGRDETVGATPSPSPTPTRSPSPAASPGAGSGSQSIAERRVVAQQQTPTPTPTPTSGGSTPSPTPSATPTRAPASPSPTGTPAPSGPGGRSEPDDTDVVEKNWSAVPTRLTMTPESDTAAVGSCNTFTITATDASGNPVPSVVVDVEQRHERSDNTTANDEPTVSFCRPGETEGANPTDVDPSRGDLGTGSDGTVGGETDAATDARGQVTIGIRVTPSSGSNGTGNVLVSAFYENEDNDDPDTGDPQDTSTKTWVASQARSIDCTPERASNQIGTEHTVTCTVRDSNGQAAQGEGVTFSEEGPGTFTTPTQRTTNAQGVVTSTVTSDEPGVQTITGRLESSTLGEPDADECDRAANDPQGAPAGVCADSVEKTWTRGRAVSRGPCKNFFEDTRTRRSGGGQVIVGTRGDDELVGTSGNDIICGLGGNDRIRGRGGNDRILGNGGRDRIQGDGGNDRISGGGGRDVLKGERGRDRLSGGGQNDAIRGGAGRDELRGNAGDDRLFGGSGSDALFGNRGDDLLDGGGGRDDCSGGSGTDVLRACE